MTNENKAASMDAVGEMYDMGNLLLREFGYPHLPDPAFVPEPKKSQSDAWNDAGTKPDHPCLCETMHEDDAGRIPVDSIYQYWTGEFFSIGRVCKLTAMDEKGVRDLDYQDVQWREVQP